MWEGASILPGFQDQAQDLVSVYTCLCCLGVGSVRFFPHDGGAGRNVMIYLVTKQLKYPLQRSSDDGSEVVGGALVAYP